MIRKTSTSYAMSKRISLFELEHSRIPGFILTNAVNGIVQHLRPESENAPLFVRVDGDCLVLTMFVTTE